MSLADEDGRYQAMGAIVVHHRDDYLRPICLPLHAILYVTPETRDTSSPALIYLSTVYMPLFVTESYNDVIQLMWLAHFNRGGEQ